MSRLLNLTHFLHLLLLSLLLTTHALNSPSFDSAKLVIDSLLLHTPFNFNISFRPTRTVGNDEIVVVTLPRFTTGLAENETAANISFGSLLISPSYKYEARFIAGNSLNTGIVPYKDAELHLRPILNDTFTAAVEYTIRIYAENGIGAVCGFPSSEVANVSGNFIKDSKPFQIFTRADNDAAVLGTFSQDRNDTYDFDFYSGLGAGCAAQSSCNLRGKCNYCFERCECFTGFGGTGDLVLTGRDLAADCSSRVCPAGKAFADLPSAANKAHAVAECAGQGSCDRATGRCKCFFPFEGAACERRRCPNDCSGHGQCLSMNELTQLRHKANPKNANFEYGSADQLTTTSWDWDLVHGCLCDSSWPVGYGDGETQLSEWFGADCSLKRCPSGNDPYTTLDETNCRGKSQLPPVAFSNKLPLADPEKGFDGNKCYVACANRGLCDNVLGTCVCFEGSWGQACDNFAGAGRRHWDSGSDEDTFWLASVNTSIIVEGN
mmetsp:Transcript_30583/g.68364  ORF Transcript_30583/g.68364 Transcript_30583/m.68364 type:complete len:492 (-) Transcript_30583:3-1478(-)